VLTLPKPAGLPARVNGRLPDRWVAGVAERLGLYAPVLLHMWPESAWYGRRIDALGQVYLAFDDNAGFGGLGEDFSRRMREEENKLLRACDVCLGVSPNLLARFQESNPRSYLQENGVDLADFTPAALAAAPEAEVFAEVRRAMPAAPIAGFVGFVDDRIDQDLVLMLARRRRDVAFVFAGPTKDGVDVSALAAESNIFVGSYVPYEHLGGVYRNYTVGLVPYVLNELTQACNPLKAYEYLACGLPVVTTNLAGLNTVRNVADVTSSPDAFAEALDRRLQDPAADRDKRLAAAAGTSWERRTDQLEQRLREARGIDRERRLAQGRPLPRPDRGGHQVVRIEPRLDEKDQSVLQFSDGHRRQVLTASERVEYYLTRRIGRASHLVRRLGNLLRGETEKVQRILVVRHGHLGDTVVFFPTLAALRRRFPEARITVATGPGSGSASLLEQSPYVDEVMELDFFRGGRAARWKGALRMLAHRFDLVLGGVWYFHLTETIFSGAPQRLGLYDGHPLQRYADAVVPLDPTLHEAENNLRLAELVCGPVAPADRVPRMDLDEPKVCAEAAKFREALQLPANAAFVVLHPGSKRPSRRWAPERFAGLATALLRERPELFVLLSGAGDDEKQLVARIREQIPQALRDRALDAVGVGSLFGLIGVLDEARCLVCNDTGVMHVARARGTPVVAIVGPENERRWGPHPLGPAPAAAVSARVPGAPHNNDVCHWNLALQSISTDRVAKQVRAVLDATLDVEPIDADGKKLWPVHREVEDLDFFALADRGVEVPRVAIVLSASPRLLGLADGPVAASRQAQLDAVAAAARTHYPKSDVVLVTNDEEVAPDDATVLRTAASPTTGDTRAADAAWSSLLASTEADLFLLLTCEDRPDPQMLARAVDTHLRGPIAEVVEGTLPVAAAEAATLWSGNVLRRRWLLTRAALHGLLQSPLPSRPATPPLEDAPLRATPASLAQVPLPTADSSAREKLTGLLADVASGRSSNTVADAA
jgi:ADP-heptose:LPS heptosyltransferase/glycosyltransferase involved in cell wall biosynthesis